MAARPPPAPLPARGFVQAERRRRLPAKQPAHADQPRPASRCVQFVVRASEKDRSTLVRTATILTAVVISRSWDFFFVEHVFTRPSAPLTCDGGNLYFLMACVAGTIALATLRSGRMAHFTVICFGLLVGWAFKAAMSVCQVYLMDYLAEKLGWPEGANTAHLGVIFAIVVTMSSVSLIYVLGLIDNYLRRVAHRHNRQSGGDHLQRLAMSTRLDGLANMILRARTLLANAIGLGVAATYNMVLEQLISLGSYRKWASDAGPSGPKACGHEASLLGDLPDPIVLSVIYAYVLISLCAIANVTLVDIRGRDAFTIRSEAAKVVQAAMRGLSVRRAQWARLRMLRRATSSHKDQAQGPSSHVVNHEGVVKGDRVAGPLKCASVGQVVDDHATESERQKRGQPVKSSPSSPPPKSTTGSFLSAVMRKVRQEKHTEATGDRLQTQKKLAVARLRLILLELLSKCLGFLVGWAWYDVLDEISTPMFHSLPESIADIIFGLVLTIICTVYTITFGHQTPPGNGRAASERIFLADALGMMQGWAWSYVVGRYLQMYLGVLQSNHIITSTNRVASAVALLLAVFGISAVMLTSLVFITRPTSAMTRAKWRRGLTAIRMKAMFGDMKGKS